MTTMQHTQSQLEDRFGRLMAARLTSSTAELPYGISERLRAARVQALARRQVGLQVAQSVSGTAGQATLSGDEHVSLWRRLASVLPLLALAAGLVTIHVIQNERRASEVAEVDAAILTDELPPAAYADPGFVQFLKSDR